MERLLDLCPAVGDVLDVGANVGLTSLRLARRTSGRVMGVEPDPVNYARCVRNLALNHEPNLTVLNVGLSDHDGPATIDRPDEHNRGMNRVGSAGVPIVLTTLDALVEAHGLHSVRLIKVDVEGHEPYVLRGATRTLALARPVLFLELSDHLLRIQGSSAPDLVKQLRSLGYDVNNALTGSRIEVADTSGVAMDVICTPIEKVS